MMETVAGEYTNALPKASNMSISNPISKAPRTMLYLRPFLSLSCISLRDWQARPLLCQ